MIQCSYVDPLIKVITVVLSAGTIDDDMYSLVAATHALKNGTDDMYANECQDPNEMEQSLVEGDRAMEPRPGNRAMDQRDRHLN